MLLNEMKDISEIIRYASFVATNEKEKEAEKNIVVNTSMYSVYAKLITMKTCTLTSWLL